MKRKSELDYVKLSILGKGTCFGEDDYFRDRGIMHRRKNKSEWECSNNPKLQLKGRSYCAKVISSKLKVYELTGPKILEAFSLLGHYKIPFFRKSTAKKKWVCERIDDGSDIASMMNKYSESHDDHAEIRQRLHPGNIKIESPRKIKYQMNRNKPIECPQRPMSYISQKMKNEINLQNLKKSGKKITISDPKNDFNGKARKKRKKKTNPR